MLAILSLMLVLTLSLLVTRVASVALTHTGMSRETARFQARSAFSGVGFTTSEAEAVVGHPVRRRIVMWLMLVGNVGIITAMTSLLVSVFGMQGHSGWPFELLLLLGGLVALLLFASSRWVDRQLSRAISWALRRFTSLDARDYASLLHLVEEYGISELRVAADDWLAGRTLEEARLTEEGVVVLGVECPGNHYLGAPSGSSQIREGDTLLLYGRASRIAELDCRPRGEPGNRSHDAARSEQSKRSREEHARAGR